MATGIQKKTKLRRSASAEADVSEVGNDGDESGSCGEVGPRDDVVEVGSEEARAPVAPHHRVGLLVRVPHPQSHAEPRASGGAHTRSVVDKVHQHQHTSININGKSSMTWTFNILR